MISVTDLIQQYRRKASEFNQRADALENDLKVLGIESNPTNGPKVKRAPSGKEFNRANVHEYLKKHSARIQGLSAAFAVTVETVEAFVKDSNNQVKDKGRGWLEVVEEAADPFASPEEEPV